jgi:hypothetical protein
MKKSDTVYILGCVFSAMTAFFYCCTMWFSVKLPRYYPLQHTWKWSKQEGVPSQGWYGMQTFAFLLAAVAAVVVYLVLTCTRLKGAELKPTAARSIGALATLIVVVCMGYMLYYEFCRWGIF